MLSKIIRATLSVFLWESASLVKELKVRRAGELRASAPCSGLAHLLLMKKCYFMHKMYQIPRDLRIFEIRFEFESDASDSIRFESDGLIRNFRIGRTCRHTTNYSHCSTKTYNRCTVVIEIYFMFIILAKRDYVTFD